MGENLILDFSIDKENVIIYIKRIFDANLTRVQNAYTQAEILDKWWAPKPWQASTKKMDFKVGGSWQYAMRGPAGEEHWAISTYELINDQALFVATDAFCDEDGHVNKDLPSSKWKVKFTERDAKTWVEMEIVFQDIKQLETTIDMGFKEGITMAMVNLDELLTA